MLSMRQYTYKRLLFCLLSTFMLAACVEDKGNYDYHDLTEIQVSGIDDAISVLTNEQLQLTPTLNPDETTEGQYSYEWKVITKDDIENEEETVISTARNLDYLVKLKADVYNLYYTITDNNTGVYWQKCYTLTVNDITTEGWMVLCSDNGRARLDMFSDVTNRLYTDLLKDYPTLNSWKGPRKIQVLSSTMTDANSPFYLLTDDGTTRLGKNNFDWKESYLLQYEAAVDGGSLRPYSITTAGFGKMMVSGTKAYFCEMGLGIDGLYQSAVNKDFDVAPYIGVNVGATLYAAVYLLYDTTNKRFMAYCPLLTTTDLGEEEPLQTMAGMESIAEAHKKENREAVVNTASFDYPTGLDFVYMENTGYDPGNSKMGTTYTILSDNGRYQLYGLQMGDMLMYSSNTFVMGKTYYGDLSGCTDITRAGQLFAFSSYKNYMYYAVGGTVYRVDLSSTPLRAERQFTLTGETITCIKFNIHLRSTNANKNYNLVVGSVDSSGNGTLRVYEGFNSEGDFSKVQPTTYTGFSRIVDATYRERE